MEYSKNPSDLAPEGFFIGKPQKIGAAGNGSDFEMCGYQLWDKVMSLRI